MAAGISAFAAVVALITALAALAVSLATYRGSFRPLVRPVPKRFPNNDINASVLVLKNIGRGPAVSVFLIEPPPPPGLQWPPGHNLVVTTTDVVEPLGGPLKGGGEESRIGRVEVPIPNLRMLRRDTTYRLLYQDLLSHWHETTFRIDKDQRLTTRYRGRLWWPPDEVPREVLNEAQVVRDSEGS
jgi:hypothetical protein